MAVMMPRESWTDERLDDLLQRVREIDRRALAEFRAIRAKTDEEFRLLRKEMREEIRLESRRSRF